MNKKYYKNINETIYSEKLENGLSVFVVPKEDFDKTYGIISVRYGGIDNRFIPRGEKELVEYPKGIAHFLEHKLFEMEDGVDASLYLTKLGASSNAFTAFDRTSYLFSTTSNVIECTKYLLDFVQKPYFTAENIKKECGIIEQEIKMYLDDPDSKLFWGTLKNLYKDNFVSTDLVGTVESINKITKEMLYNCYNTFYHPSNMQLFIIGNVELNIFDAIRENQASKTFLPYEEIKREYVYDEFKPYINEKKEYMDVLIPKVALGVRFNKIFDNPQMIDIKLGLLSSILTGESSDFKLELMNEGLINDTFGYYSDFNKSASYFILSGDSEEPDKLFDRLNEFVKDIPNKKIDEELFECARRNLIGQYISLLNSIEATAQMYTTCIYSGNDLYTMIDEIKKFKISDLDEVKELFKNCIITKYEIFPNDETNE